MKFGYHFVIIGFGVGLTVSASAGPLYQAIELGNTKQLIKVLKAHAVKCDLDKLEMIFGSEQVAFFSHKADSQVTTDSYTQESLSERPSELADEIERVYSTEFKGASPKDLGWEFNGSSDYEGMYLELEQLLRWSIERADNKKEISILDFGSGNFKWPIMVARLLNEKFKDSKKIFHVYGATGEIQYEKGTEELEKEYSSDFVKLHLKQETRLEQIDQVYKDSSFDLIVSNWALRHMVDGLGTFKRLYNLLSQNTGIMSIDSFSVHSNDSYFNLKALLYSSNVAFIAIDRPYYRGEMHPGDFLIFKDDSKSAYLPVSYAEGLKKHRSKLWAKFKTTMDLKRRSAVYYLDEATGRLIEGPKTIKSLFEKYYGLLQKSSHYIRIKEESPQNEMKFIDLIEKVATSRDDEAILLDMNGLSIFLVREK